VSAWSTDFAGGTAGGVAAQPIINKQGVMINDKTKKSDLGLNDFMAVSPFFVLAG
jgi:hypothetical protein